MNNFRRPIVASVTAHDDDILKFLSCLLISINKKLVNCCYTRALADGHHKSFRRVTEEGYPFVLAAK